MTAQEAAILAMLDEEDRAAMPHIITSLAEQACDDSMRVIDSVRAGRMLMEVAGFLKPKRRGRR